MQINLFSNPDFILSRKADILSVSFTIAALFISIYFFRLAYPESLHMNTCKT